MPNMPKLPVEAMLTASGLKSDCADHTVYGKFVGDMLRKAFNSKTGCIRTAKPFADNDFRGDAVKFAKIEDSMFKACANYLWRRLAFDFCDFKPYVCIPVSHDWPLFAVIREEARRAGLEKFDDWYEREGRIKSTLESLLLTFERTLPIELQRGAMRWGRAFGLV